MDITLVLHGNDVRLESLSRADHLDNLQRPGAHPEIFRWFTEDHS